MKSICFNVRDRASNHYGFELLGFCKCVGSDLRYTVSDDQSFQIGSEKGGVLNYRRITKNSDFFYVTAAKGFFADQRYTFGNAVVFS